MKTILAIFLLFMSFHTSAQYAEIKHCTAKEFSIAMDSCMNKVILDIRPESFTGNYKIEGALVATNKSKLTAILDTLDVDNPIFLYCVEGVRSKKASKIVQENGFQYIFNLKKGVTNYKRKGYPVVDVLNEE